MHLNIKLLFLTLIATQAVLGKVNGKCSSGNGVCVSTSSCTKAGGTYVNGLCPSDPSNIKCCNKSKCVAPNGKVGSCMFTSACKGTTYSNLCPGGSDFKCCVTNATTTKAKAKTTTKANTSINGNKIVSYAKQFIGNPYVYGGNSLTKGCDCSGFTKLIFAKFGITLPRVSSDQATKGKSVSGLSNAKPADLIFYCSSGSVNHVAIYEGNNRIVHAANSKDGIKESNANYKTPCKIRRFI